MNKNSITLTRLLKYHTVLQNYKKLGLHRVFSSSLSDAVGATALQVRKDFSCFGITGNKKGGYYVDTLLEQINTILHKNDVRKIIIVGVGDIGSALMKFKSFENNGIKIVACFDIEPENFYSDSTIPIPVLPLEQLKQIVSSHDIKLGILSVPSYSAQYVADFMISAGIKAILNFTPIKLRVPTYCLVRELSIIHELDRLFYLLNYQNGGED